MRRSSLNIVLALMALLPSAALAGSPAAHDEILVLPLRPIGVNPALVDVVTGLLAGELEGKGLIMIDPGDAQACESAACAEEVAIRRGAGRVVYGSVGALGDKRVVRIHALTVSEERPDYSDQFITLTDEDLETVMVRIAEGIAGGYPNSDRATVESVIQRETEEPNLRASRRGLGLRAGVLYPSGESFGAASRLVNLRMGYKRESPDHFFETTFLTDLAWGDDAMDWTLFSVYGARILGRGDFSPYIGVGLGLHQVHVEGKATPITNDYGYTYTASNDQSETTLAIEFGAGILNFRTYGMEVIFDARYRIIVDKFDKVNGKGAHGILLSFGTSG